MSIEVGQQGSLWAVRLAVAIWFLYFPVWIATVAGAGPPTRRRIRLLAGFWTTATLLHVVHVVLAFGYFHDWSHQVATEHTALRTASYTGIHWGGGIWFNHLFLLVCLVETWLWWRQADFVLRRSRWWSGLIYGFCLFIIFNAAVVFVSGTWRWLNLAGFFCLAVFAVFVRRGRRAGKVPGDS